MIQKVLTPLNFFPNFFPHGDNTHTFLGGVISLLPPVYFENGNCNQAKNRIKFLEEMAFVSQNCIARESFVQAVIFGIIYTVYESFNSYNFYYLVLS